MKLTTLKKYQGIIITLLQTIAILFIALIITVLHCGFDFEKFNWLTFALNFSFSTFMKLTYTQYAKNKEKMTENIMLLESTINHDRKQIYDAQKTEDFEKEVERRNKINKLEAYIAVLDDKKQNLKNQEIIRERRNWAFDYKTALEKDQDTIEFERIRSIKSIKVVYEKIEASKLFTFGQNSKERKRKYSFNSFGSTMNRMVVPTTITLIFSVILGAIQNESYLETGEVWIDLAGYLFSIIMGAWWGLMNGKAIIQEDYAEVLNNVVILLRDIKTKIFEEDKKNKFMLPKN